MKKNEWEYLAKVMWAFAESNNGKISPLLKELIKKINKNLGVIIDDMGEYGEIAETTDRLTPTQQVTKISGAMANFDVEQKIAILNILNKDKLNANNLGLAKVTTKMGI